MLVNSEFSTTTTTTTTITQINEWRKNESITIETNLTQLTIKNRE